MEIKELRIEDKSFGVTFKKNGEEHSLRYYYNKEKGYLLMFGDIKKAKEILKKLFKGKERIKLIVSGFYYDERIVKIKILEDITKQIEHFMA